MRRRRSNSASSLWVLCLLCPLFGNSRESVREVITWDLLVCVLGLEIHESSFDVMCETSVCIFRHHLNLPCWVLVGSEVCVQAVAGMPCSRQELGRTL